MFFVSSYCHGFSDRRRGIGLTIGFNAHFNQLQLIISILQPPTLWAPFSIGFVFQLIDLLNPVDSNNPITIPLLTPVVARYASTI
jgi:hypothetical protein